MNKPHFHGSIMSNTGLVNYIIKKLFFLLKLLMNCISARSAPKILPIKDYL